jgi:hypothetical protein
MPTLESTLTRIADSLDKIAAALTLPEAASAPAPVQAPDVPAPTPVPVPPIPVPVPPIPVPVPVPPAAAAGVPTDQKSLMDYCMAKYRALGPVKGGMIQGVLTELGCANIHSLPPEKYAAFHAKVEAL